MRMPRTTTLVIAALASAVATVGQPVAADDALLRDNVVVLLDTSGSMKEPMRSTSRPKIDVAREALRTVLAGLPETTQVGLLVFATSSSQDPWVHPLGPVDRARLDSAIDKAEPRGRTPLGEYLKIAADRLLAERDAQLGYGTYRLIVVTDGEANDSKLVERHLPEILGRGLTVDAIGVDMKESHSLATRVHSYRRADDPETLVRSLREVFAEVGRAGADDAGDAVDHYAVIAPLPDGAANLLLSGLARSGNEPIGERRRRDGATRAAPDASGSSGATHPASAPHAATPSGGTTPATVRRGPSFVTGFLVCSGIGMAILIAVARIARAAGGRA